MNNLTKLGYKHHGFTTGYTDEIQLRWSYYLDITKSMDDIMMGMDQSLKLYPFSLLKTSLLP